MLNLATIYTFVKVCDLGSFNKAAEDLYLSPNSVMNQINSLEDELGKAKLLKRSKKGVELTEAGKTFYDDAVRILNLCDEAKRNVRATAYSSDTVKLATYYGMPLDFFNNIWRRAKAIIPTLNVEMILYDGSRDAYTRYLSELGESVDLLTGTIDARFFDPNIHNGLELTKIPLYAMMNSNHRLSDSTNLSTADFKGETLLFPSDHWSTALDLYLETLQADFPDIKIKTYDPAEILDIYSFCAGGNDILIHAYSFTMMHPFLSAIPIEDAPRSSFGLIYSKDPSLSVETFVKTLEESRDQLRLDNK